VLYIYIKERINLPKSIALVTRILQTKFRLAGVSIDDPLEEWLIIATKKK